MERDPLSATTPGASEEPVRLDAEELTALQPGLARLMPEVGARMWKAYHAAEARNWAMAAWQLRELEKLLAIGIKTRPKYRQDLQAFITEDLAPLHEAAASTDLVTFRSRFDSAVAEANEYHRRWQKPWIVWKLPAAPPPDLDLAPSPAPPGRADR